MRGCCRVPGPCWWRGLGRRGHNSSGFSNPPPACLQKQLMAVEGDEMGLAADSKGSTSCPAGQCARCPPLHASALRPQRGEGLGGGCPGWVPPALAVPDILGGCSWITGALVGCSRVGAQPAWHSLEGSWFIFCPRSSTEWVLGTRGTSSRSWGHPVPATGNVLSPLWSPPARMEKQTWWREALCRVGGCSSCVSLGCKALGGAGRWARGAPGAGAAPGPSCSAAGARVCAARSVE